MIMNYVTKIRGKVSIYASKKTSNLFDGSYKSIYQGNGLNFENLREYIPGDNIRDIDWKSSSRTGKLLVKKYIAEKKHNIMLIFDTGKKMTADTKALQTKKNVALNMGGTIAYLAAKNGDHVGALYNRNGMIQYYQLKTGMYHLERILTEYDKEDFSDYYADLEKNFEYLIKNIRRKMILVIITDASGIQAMREDMLKKLTVWHDVLVVNISDADISNGTAYDVDENSYIPDFISKDRKLSRVEQQTKQRIAIENEKKLLKYRIVSTQVDSEDEIVDKVIDLLGRHKDANYR